MPSLPSANPGPQLCPVSAIGSCPIDWLWLSHLALGELAVLEGDPGLGKSFVALDLCARLSTGRPWPDDAPAPAPANSIVLNGEDDPERTLGPRLAGLGADLSRVFVLDRQGTAPTASLSLPTDVKALDALVAQVQARLVVIDPVLAFLSAEVNVCSNASVRRALAPLAALARDHACAVLLIRHLAKAGRGRAIHRGLGAIGLAGTCRSVWLVAQDTETPARRVLAQVKNNLAPVQPSLAFEVVVLEGGPPALHWRGPAAVSADDLQAPLRRGRPPLQRDAACAFLQRVLAQGPLPAREVWRHAEKEGITRGTLAQARHHLPVKLGWGSVNGLPITYWMLTDQDLPPNTPPTEEPDPIFERLRQLEEQYPSRSPLDDM